MSAGPQSCLCSQSRQSSRTRQEECASNLHPLLFPSEGQGWRSPYGKQPRPPGSQPCCHLSLFLKTFSWRALCRRRSCSHAQVFRLVVGGGGADKSCTLLLSEHECTNITPLSKRTLGPFSYFLLWLTHAARTRADRGSSLSLNPLLNLLMFL